MGCLQIACMHMFKPSQSLPGRHQSRQLVNVMPVHFEAAQKAAVDIRVDRVSCAY